MLIFDIISAWAVLSVVVTVTFCVIRMQEPREDDDDAQMEYLAAWEMRHV